MFYQMGRQPKSEADKVHDRIGVLRADRGVSRKELATAVGVHPQTIGYVERGEYSPSLALALRIAHYFNLPVELIFSLDPLPSLSEELLRRTT